MLDAVNCVLLFFGSRIKCGFCCHVVCVPLEQLSNRRGAIILDSCATEANHQATAFPWAVPCVGKATVVGNARACLSCGWVEPRIWGSAFDRRLRWHSNHSSDKNGLQHHGFAVALELSVVQMLLERQRSSDSNDLSQNGYG